MTLESLYQRIKKIEELMYDQRLKKLEESFDKHVKRIEAVLLKTRLD